MVSLIKKAIIILIATLTAAYPELGGFINSHRPYNEDFRVTTYVVADTILDKNNLHKEDFNIITDAILFGAARFDQRGNVILDEEKFEPALNNLKEAIGERDVKIHLNILGPDYNGESSDWYDLMKKQGREHNKAFISGRLENNIKNILYDYDLDGIFFDYEYPIDKLNWFCFSKFLVSLDRKIGDKILGVALADWDLHLDAQAIDAIDYVEFMLYDVYDDEGRHATTETCKALSKKAADIGIPNSKIDFGLPFYARPTDHGAYWYGYNSYADLIDDNNFYYDKNIDKTFYFNTPTEIYDKTSYAIENGFGGVMIWHYSCDFPSSDTRSLLRSINKSIYNMQGKKPFTGSDYTIPEIDLSSIPSNLVGSEFEYLFNLTTVDNSIDYLAHPDAVLLKNGDILSLYPAGHGKGAILNKISTDGGLSWDESILNTPESWKNSKETPTVYRLEFSDGTPDKLILISANPKWWDEETTKGGFNCSISLDEGKTWSEFESFYGLNTENPVVPIVAMSSLTRLKENGKFVDKWMGLFHDSEFYNYKTILTFDESGNMHWSKPEKYFSAYRQIEKESNMCEVEIIRSENGTGNELCLISRSNSKTMNSLISFSNDEGRTWSTPIEAPAALNGERHKAQYTNDGRLFITFRSIERGPKAAQNAKPMTNNGFISEGWVAWVGTYDDLKRNNEGQYRIKLAHIYADETKQQRPEYYAGSDTGYCGNVLLPDGTIVTMTYGKFNPADKLKDGSRRTYIASKRINLKDTDRLLALIK